MSPKVTITHLSDLTPPSQERTWLTAPHPTLPIVATCSSDKTIRVYSLTNFTLLSTITGGHKRSVRTAAWKPHMAGESVLATGSFDATVGIWRRWDNYGQEDGVGMNSGHTQNQTDTSTAAPSGTDAADREEDEEEWRFAVLLDGHDSEVKSVSWSASGMLLATCSRDKSIWIWEDLDDGDNNFETVAVMQEHSGDVKCVSWHPSEECLASASYDDTIRLWREDLDDWGQVACIKGHEGTVWFLDWEGEGSKNWNGPISDSVAESELSALYDQWRSQRALSGPRIVSCSDDRTVRVWRRQPKASQQNGPMSSATTGIPSIIRPTGTDEIWEEDAVLPHAHELPVYAVAWSKRTGLVASTGADGRIALYEERFITQEQQADSDAMDTTSGDVLRTEWVLVGVQDGAHGIYEVNHVAWAKRADRGSGGEEEVLVSTADDGSVKVWTVTR
ncbi:uncharacterized protein N7479_009840 [Penicillium vulpinum]|uniref:Probable cytosolic iron-sulfur protein assembly protein 1 n=1 Tax=Penicillium vulpinum TaxID=29845 RepID=A0A1V6RYH6_9EURO|nr:uncharacterized protein N7479_009840 [Penicillium vulpinum]KAJ5951427.1 hypothetical protein N7479_009840 [Penicillium vulpinum]OQE06569.1 hypothetical protein PENVUL_c017G08661 [Penicillium vulpinum]